MTDNGSQMHRKYLWRMMLGFLVLLSLIFVLFESTFTPRVIGAFPLIPRWVIDFKEDVRAISARDEKIAIRTESRLILLDNKGEQIWSYYGLQDDITPAVIYDGAIYISSSENVIAISMSSGRKLWEYHYDDHSSSTNISTVSDCCLIINKTARGILSINRANGTLLWMYNIGRGNTDVLLYDDQVYFTLDYELRSLELETGDVRLVIPLRGSVIASTIKDGKLIYSTVSGWKRYSIIAVSLEETPPANLWEINASEETTSMGKFNLSKDAIFLTSDTHVSKIDIDAGEIAWSRRSGFPELPVILRSTVYIRNRYLGIIEAIDIQTGERRGLLFNTLPELVPLSNRITMASTADLLVFKERNKIYAFGK